MDTLTSIEVWRLKIRIHAKCFQEFIQRTIRIVIRVSKALLLSIKEIQICPLTYTDILICKLICFLLNVSWGETNRRNFRNDLGLYVLHFQNIAFLMSWFSKSIFSLILSYHKKLCNPNLDLVFLILSILFLNNSHSFIQAKQQAAK